MPATALQNTLVHDDIAEDAIAVDPATATPPARPVARAVARAGAASTAAPYLRAVRPPAEGAERERAMAAHPSNHHPAGKGGRPVLRALVEAPVSRPAPTAPLLDDAVTTTQTEAPRTEAEAPTTQSASLPGEAASVAPAADLAAEPAVEPGPVERAGRMDDPGQLCAALALCVVEIIAGARPLEQVGYWVTDAVHLHLLRRSVIASRARAVAAEEPMRPRVRIGVPRLFEPREGVVEAVVMVHQTSRSRAMTIRLERHRNRWRATALSML